MKKVYILIAFLVSTTLLLSHKPDEKRLAIGTANPGLIKIYSIDKGEFKEIKKIDSGYKYVWTVRIGDIYNNGKKYLIAGVSDSLYGESFSCKVVGYDLEKYQKFEIDEVDSFRCKDLTIGDADNDGDNDIILVTHGIGLIRMYSWDGKEWQKEDLDKNYIAEVDKATGANHRVPNDQLPCSECVVQTAVHIAKIGDVDNDGKNEVVTSISSPLELQNVPERGLIKVYKKEGGRWKSQVIDEFDDIEARGLFIADIYNNGRNALLVGTGTPRTTPAGVYAYEFQNNKWNKKLVYSNGVEKNMKAMTIGDIFNDGVQRIVFSTGFPDAKTFITRWKDNKFAHEEIGRASREMKIKDAEYNSMAVVLNKTPDGTQIINGGFITFPKKKKGAEASDRGFLTIYTQKNGKWMSEIIDNSSIWAMDLN
jgi:WD40 repeat protein